MASQKPQLVILAPSHYCEKASWALQRYAIPYDLTIVAPGFHSGIVKKAGSKATSTPVLILPAPQTAICDSADIVEWVDQHRSAAAPTLFPSDKRSEIKELLERFDHKFGASVRLFVYSQCLDTSEMLNGLCAGTPTYQQVAYALGMKYIVRSVIRKSYKVNDENGRAALEICREEFQRVSNLLSDGRKFLTGDSFTAADLSFISLAATLLSLKYGYAHTYEKSARPIGLQAAIDEFRSTPAGKWAQRVWDDERKRVIS